VFIVVVVVRGRRSDDSNNCHTDAAASRHALRRCPVVGQLLLLTRPHSLVY
jgi:hypothetical protein